MVKKISFLLLCVFVWFVFLVGCKTLATGVDYYNICKNDSECYARMKVAESTGQNLGELATSSGFSSYGVAKGVGAVIGWFMSLVVAYKGGKKIALKKGD